MIITCPSCKTKFRLEEETLRSPHEKMRCSRCGNVWVYDGAEAQTAEQAYPEEEPLLKKVRVEREKPGRKSLLALTISIIIVIILGGGFYLYWENYLGAGDKWLQIRKLEGQEMVTKEGKVFLITGVAYNGSTKPRKLIVVKAKLFDKDSKPIGEKDTLCGLALSREQVQTMQKTDIETRINAFKLSPPENFVVESKREMPFAVIFFDEDFAKAKEFTVEILESPPL